MRAGKRNLDFRRRRLLQSLEVDVSRCDMKRSNRESISLNGWRTDEKKFERAKSRALCFLTLSLTQELGDFGKGPKSDNENFEASSQARPFTLRLPFTFKTTLSP